MIRLFNNNLAFERKKENTSTLFSVFLTKRLHIFFEFDNDLKTIAWLPKIRKVLTAGKGFRLVFLMFSFGVIKYKKDC